MPSHTTHKKLPCFTASARERARLQMTMTQDTLRAQICRRSPPVRDHEASACASNDDDDNARRPSIEFTTLSVNVGKCRRRCLFVDARTPDERQCTASTRFAFIVVNDGLNRRKRNECVRVCGLFVRVRTRAPRCRHIQGNGGGNNNAHITTDDDDDAGINNCAAVYKESHICRVNVQRSDVCSMGFD